MKPTNSPKRILGTIALLAAAAFPCCVNGEEAKAPAGANAAPSAYTGKPYGGTMQVIPGIVQAEYYDVAPENVNGITYNRKGEPKKGPVRTTGDAVGLAQFGKGHVTIKNEPEAPEQVYVGWTAAGQWWKYTVQVKESGTYLIGTHIAAGRKGGKISLSFGPQITTGPIEIPTTAGYVPEVEVYHVWEKLDKLAEVKLAAGVYVMTVQIETDGGLNIDWFSFTKKP